MLTRKTSAGKFSDLKQCSDWRYWKCVKTL